MDKVLMPPIYNPGAIEHRQYRYWLEKGCFTAGRKGSGDRFTIVIPPPNVTGTLHMGHALNGTIQDIIIRWRRMQGYDTLWLPGTDHAGIATQIRVEEHLLNEGITRHQLGRDHFVEKVWEWKEVYHSRITEQLQRLGVSCDWTRERFTMDEGCSRAVRKVFVDLYRKGLIYRGDYLINWCPRCRTALSDIEVEHEEKPSTLTFIRYPLVGGEGSITVATTRPETMLGDTAVAVNPDDERYCRFVGKKAQLPLMDREIPIIADSYVDPSFGTGAVKITPGHDPNDFEIGQRHHLEAIQVIGKEGLMTASAGRFAGLSVDECRRQVVEELTALGLIEKIDEYKHAVGQCQRCAADIEPLVSRQWFVKMKPLAAPAIAAVEKGRIKFVPERFTRTYLNWVENVRDWCISRQIWWGHRIPAWYCSCGEMVVDYQKPAFCPTCGRKELTQDPDVLDTWFSSALWPFSTLGWPEQTADLKQYFPTNVLVTGYDIIYFWVARMIFMSLEFLGEIPFGTVYINGLVRDHLGRKMSKSLGNGIDPLEVIGDYGADTLRFTLITGQAPGHDQRFRQENVEAGRNFSNKIWNASRFVLMNLSSSEAEGESPEPDFTVINPLHLPPYLKRIDRWILHRYNEVVGKVTERLEQYELGEAARLVYEFLWNDFCDWYLEFGKYYLYRSDEGKEAAEDRRLIRGILVYVLEGVLKLLHPFMPFITEEIWHNFREALSSGREPLAVSSWPRFYKELVFPQEAKEMAVVQEVIRAIRNLRSQVQLPPTKRTAVILRTGDRTKAVLLDEEHHLSGLALAGPLTIDRKISKPHQALTAVIGKEIEIYLPLSGVIDLKAEVARLQKELQQVEKDLNRTSGKLANQGFLRQAPPEIVDKEQARGRELVSRKDKLNRRIQELT